MDYSLEQNLGDTQGPARRSRFIPHCVSLTSFLGPACLLHCVLFEICLHGHTVLSVSQLEIIAETIRYAPVTMLRIISSISDRGRCTVCDGAERQ